MKIAEQEVERIEASGSLLPDVHRALANFYDKEYKDSVHAQLSFDHYCKAFSAGDQKSVYDLCWAYFINDKESSSLKASVDDLLRIAKEKEESSTSSNLAYLLGLVYYNGYRVGKDQAEAEKWFLIAKDKGSLSAYCKLAYYYINEKRERNKGFTLLEEAYQKGSVEGTRLLGMCYKIGIGVKKDRSKARSLLKEAAKKGDKDAAQELRKIFS